MKFKFIAQTLSIIIIIDDAASTPSTDWNVKYESEKEFETVPSVQKPYQFCPVEQCIEKSLCSAIFKPASLSHFPLVNPGNATFILPLIEIEFAIVNATVTCVFWQTLDGLKIKDVSVKIADVG
mmetsp:Transcript_11421/g.13020  ORF Transcript_11421/g.13020 Transcript_11421/m.13020 type:complete len:124 (-) Transcript_11421:280-651(-)